MNKPSIQKELFSPASLLLFKRIGICAVLALPFNFLPSEMHKLVTVSTIICFLCISVFCFKMEDIFSHIHIFNKEEIPGEIIRNNVNSRVLAISKSIAQISGGCFGINILAVIGNLAPLPTNISFFYQGMAIFFTIFWAFHVYHNTGRLAELDASVLKQGKVPPEFAKALTEEEEDDRNSCE